MNIYLLSQSYNDEYDTFDSIVVSAPDEDSAKKMSPYWNEQHPEFSEQAWAPISEIQVQLIGRSCVEQKIIISSFNAG